MSALTDLFTSLANKIRSKLGTSTTYTPAQAIAAIDNVYNKGVSDTKVGTAGVGDVKSGKTFTNANGVGLTGTFAAQTKTVDSPLSDINVVPDSGKYLSQVTVKAIAPQRDNSSVTAYGSGIQGDGNPYIQFPYGWWPQNSSASGMSFVYLSAAQAVAACPSQSKSATPSTSEQTITPDSGKLLHSVNISAISPQRSNGVAATITGQNSNGPYVYFPYGWYPQNDSTYGSFCRMTAAQAVTACPSQSKSTTSSRSAQTITPDSGKLLSSVSIAKYPDATDTYTPTGNNRNSTAADMGATNNLRYVNTNVCYQYGYDSLYSKVKYGLYQSGHVTSGQTIRSTPPYGGAYIIITSTWVSVDCIQSKISEDYDLMDEVKWVFYKVNANPIFTLQDISGTTSPFAVILVCNP